MGWTTRNLTREFGAPRAFSAPAAYLFAAERTRHVIYRELGDGSGTTGHLIELYCGADDVWHAKDITDEAGAPTATTDPSAYVFDSEGSQHVVFLSGDDGRIHELYQSDGWHHTDLMDASATVVRATDAPQGWASSHYGTQHVVFRDLYRAVHLLSRGTGEDASWVQRTLTAATGPHAATAPAGYAFDAAQTQHITLVGDDQLFYEYVMTNGTWGAPHDLGVNVGASHDTLPHPTGYAFAGDGSRHLPWQGQDRDIHELSFAAGSWTRVDLTSELGAPQPREGLAPAGYAFESNPAVPIGTRHVIHTGSDGLVHEFWNDPSGWHADPLTGGEGSFPAASAPAAFADPASATQNVFYVSDANEVIELRYSPGRFTRPAHLASGHTRIHEAL
ncbi:hypothetical protein [Leifsonia aquatica]|uniref:hypothetical protein n=1 Tax=Leifsonia aquatica TaxID=144185 RepID=UPI000468A266|nr:hypothetical protein [Leifsonia aquatica]